MCKNSSTPLINAALWHYLGTYNLDFRRENNSTPGVLIEEIQYMMHIHTHVLASVYMHGYIRTYNYAYIRIYGGVFV